MHKRIDFLVLASKASYITLLTRPIYYEWVDNSFWYSTGTNLFALPIHFMSIRKKDKVYFLKDRPIDFSLKEARNQFVEDKICITRFFCKLVFVYQVKKWASERIIVIIDCSYLTVLIVH